MAHEFVIVGAGSAGCALADQLTRSGHDVCVLEAGGSDQTLAVRAPVAFSALFKSSRDWAYMSQPEPACEQRSLFMPRGKMLGGCSSINAMLYVRGRPADYDGWRDAGCAGWGWQDVLPHFRAVEDNSRGSDEFHGAGGPLRVEDQRSPSPVSRAMISAAEAAGYPRNPDINGARQIGWTLFQVTQRRGRRWSAADAFLRPSLERGLTVRTGARALRVVFEGQRATGVAIATSAGEEIVRAEREVILSAGVFGSAQLLLLSGVGPADDLRAAGVGVRADVPGVGQNLQDHPVATMLWAGKTGFGLQRATRPWHLLRWLIARSGKLTSPVAETCGFVDSGTGLPAPDIQFHGAPGYFKEHGFSNPPGDGMSLGPVLVRPQSRGRVWLASADPLAPLRILGNHLQEEADVEALVAGLRIGREVIRQAPLDKYRGAELAPGPGVTSDADLTAYLRRHVELLYHPVGTCRMGAPDDPQAVVDPDLRVRGVSGLRVADAAVMPTITSGNTNAPSIMIGTVAAQRITAS